MLLNRSLVDMGDSLKFKKKDINTLKSCKKDMAIGLIRSSETMDLISDIFFLFLLYYPFVFSREKRLIQTLVLLVAHRTKSSFVLACNHDSAPMFLDDHCHAIVSAPHLRCNALQLGDT
jgi:hypothetical protein